MLDQVVNGFEGQRSLKISSEKNPGSLGRASPRKLSQIRALMAKPAKTGCRSDRFQLPLEVSGARSLSDHSVVTL
jgi:hypothetical protein